MTPSNPLSEREVLSILWGKSHEGQTPTLDTLLVEGEVFRLDSIDREDIAYAMVEAAGLPILNTPFVDEVINFSTGREALDYLREQQRSYLQDDNASRRA
ncbi:MAG: hypothetical protein ABIH34_05230 [Nanoarchaeota archaeon]